MSSRRTCTPGDALGVMAGAADGDTEGETDGSMEGAAPFDAHVDSLAVVDGFEDISALGAVTGRSLSKNNITNRYEYPGTGLINCVDTSLLIELL